MTTPPPLFDPTLAQSRRRRATSDGAFLQRHAAALTAERLTEVNRTFHAAAVVGPMADQWAETLTAEAGVTVSRRLDATETLPLDRRAHDLVVHGLALHHQNDPVGQLVQARLALQPDGLMIAVMFGGETLSELRHALTLAEADISGGASPRVAPMGDVRTLGALLQRAGLALPVADSVPLQVSYTDLPALMRDLRAMGETNVLTERTRTPLRRDILSRADALYRNSFGLDGGRLRATFEMMFLTGWAPADTQQRPLRPGSATHRLSEVLGAQEFGAGTTTTARRQE